MRHDFWRPAAARAVFCGLSACLAALPARANPTDPEPQCGTNTDAVWTGTTGSFDDLNNWQAHCAPQTKSDVIVSLNPSADIQIQAGDQSGEISAGGPTKSLTLDLSAGSYTLNTDPRGQPPGIFASGVQLTILGGNTLTIPANTQDDASINAASLTVSGAATLNLGSGISLSGGLSMTGGGTLNIGTGFPGYGLIAAGLTLTGGSTIMGASSVVIDGAGTITGSKITLTGSNGYLGLAAGSVINGGSTIDVQTFTMDGDISGADTKVTAALSGIEGTIEKSATVDAGTATLSNTSTPLSILSSAEFSATSVTVPGTVTVSDAKFDVSGATTVDGSLAAALSAPAPSLTFDQNATGKIDGTLTIEAGGSLFVQNGASVEADKLSLTQGSGTSSGTITLQSGGQLTDDDATIDGPNGVVTEKGTGTSWIMTGDLVIGSAGTATTAVSQGALLKIGGDLTLGDTATGNGTLNLSDNQTSIVFGSGEIKIGNKGTGALDLSNGIVFSAPADEVSLGASAGGTGTLTMTGTGTTFSTGKLTIGDSGTGTAKVSSGATLNVNGDLTLGEAANSTGSLTLDGTTTGFSISGGAIAVGSKGTGHLTVQNGMLLNAAGVDVNIGDEQGGIGTVTVTGAGTAFTTGTLTVGGEGTGTLTISSGGTVQTGADAAIGDEQTGNGTVMLTGSGSSWTVTNGLTIGGKGTAQMTIAGGAALTVSGGDLVIGDEQGSNGTLTLDGGDSSLTYNQSAIPSASGEFQVGNNGKGIFGLQDGATLTTLSISVGAGSTGNGQLNLTGAGTSLTLLNELKIGEQGTGALSMSDAALLTADGDVTFGDQQNSKGTGTITSQSTLDVGGGLSVGNGSTGALTISDGAVVNALGDSVELGQAVGGAGTLTVEGTAGSPPKASKLNFAGTLKIGDAGAGELDLSSGGEALPTSSGTGLIEMALGTDATGTVKVDGTGSMLKGTKLFVGGTDTSSGGTGTVTLTNGGSAALSDTLGLWGRGTVTLDTSSDVTVGTVSDATAGALTVGDGGTVVGIGTIAANLDNEAGTVQPGIIGGGVGTLTVTGNYTQGAGGKLAIEVSPSSASQLNVAGTAQLGGTLALAYDPGTYHDTSYTIVKATELSGDFATVTGTVPTSGLSTTVTTNSQSAILVLGTGGSGNNGGGSGNNGGGSGNNGGGSGTGSVVQPKATGVLGGPVSTLTFASLGFDGALLNRIGGGGAGTSGGALGSGGERSPPLAQLGANDPLMAQLGTSDAGHQALTMLPDAARQMGVWAEGFGNFLSLAGNRTAPGVSSEMAGFMAGLDRRVTENTTLGIAAGYGTGSLSTGDTGTGGISTVRGAVYGGTQWGRVQFAGLVGGAFDRINTSRVTGVGTALENHDAGEFNAAAKASYPIAVRGFDFVPHIGAVYLHVDQASFTETGAGGGDLAAASHNEDSLQPFVGFDLDHSFEAPNGDKGSVFVHADYWRETLSGNQDLTVTSLDGTQFLATGIVPSANRLDVGVGGAMTLSRQLAIFAQYDATLPIGNTTINSFTGGFRLTF